MGLANLVPGISGGTMILAVGLYDRFIAALADVTRLRLARDTVVFLGVLAAGVAAAILTLSGVAVGLVNVYRWAAYSLFVGLTLGGVPALVRLMRPFGPGALLAVVGGAGAMAAVALQLQGAQLAQTVPVLVLVGAAAASSMILPGVSGSYVLLVLGMYDLVIGSLSLGVWRKDFGGAMGVILPVIVGAGLGIALLSNLLKWLLGRFPSTSHGALLGLLLGSVIGLWPFQETVHPDLADERLREATVLVLTGSTHDEVRGALGEDLTDERLDGLARSWAGRTPADLKRLGGELRFFTPAAGQVAWGIGLLALGFGLTLALGRRPGGSRPGAEEAEGARGA